MQRKIFGRILSKSFLDPQDRDKNCLFQEKMKKTKLVVEYDFDFDAFGIMSSVKGYKLAWEINHRLGVHLVKQDDHVVGFKKDVEMSFSYFSFETPLNRLKLLKNKPPDGASGKYYLVPEFPHIDFIMLARLSEHLMHQPLTEIIREIPGIELISPIELEQLKSKTNFVF